MTLRRREERRSSTKKGGGECQGKTWQGKSHVTLRRRAERRSSMVLMYTNEIGFVLPNGVWSPPSCLAAAVKPLRVKAHFVHHGSEASMKTAALSLRVLAYSSALTVLTTLLSGGEE